MKNWMKAALSPFVELEESVQSPSPVSTPAFTFKSAPTSTPIATESKSHLFEEHFETLFTQANLPGPDYSEFRDMMETLEPHIPSESARMIAAFDTLKKQNLTKAHLLDTARQYIEIIKKDKPAFDSLVQQKSQEEIVQKREKAEAHAKQIAELETKAAQLKIELGELQQQANSAEQKIATRLQDYATASNAMLSMIETDITNITTNIK